MEETKGQTITIPHMMGDTVEWYCPADYKVHKSKILSVDIKFINWHWKKPRIEYTAKLKLNGSMQKVKFGESSIESAERYRKYKKYFR